MKIINIIKVSDIKDFRFVELKKELAERFGITLKMLEDCSIEYNDSSQYLKLKGGFYTYLYKIETDIKLLIDYAEQIGITQICRVP